MITPQQYRSGPRHYRRRACDATAVARVTGSRPRADPGALGGCSGADAGRGRSGATGAAEDTPLRRISATGPPVLRLSGARATAGRCRRAGARWTRLVSTEVLRVTIRSRRRPLIMLRLIGPLAGERRRSLEDDGAAPTEAPGRTIDEARMLPSPTAVTARAATAGAMRKESRRRTRETAIGCSRRSSGAARSCSVKRERARETPRIPRIP